VNEADRNRLALLLLNDGGGSLSRRSAVSNAFTSAVAPDPIEAELNTARNSAVGNPLVNTTDQWTNTVLRRAIQQAIDSDAEKIAVPRGDTVLSYNPGDDHGMNAFYNDIVPKNLAKILAGLDRQGVAQKYVSQLATPSGMRGNNFTVFDLTPAMRDAARKGMPLFAAPHAGLLPLLMQQNEQGP